MLFFMCCLCWGLFTNYPSNNNNNNEQQNFIQGKKAGKDTSLQIFDLLLKILSIVCTLLFMCYRCYFSCVTFYRCLYWGFTNYPSNNNNNNEQQNFIQGKKAGKDTSLQIFDLLLKILSIVCTLLLCYRCYFSCVTFYRCLYWGFTNYPSNNNNNNEHQNFIQGRKSWQRHESSNMCPTVKNSHCC